MVPLTGLCDDYSRSWSHLSVPRYESAKKCFEERVNGPGNFRDFNARICALYQIIENLLLHFQFAVS